MKEVAKIDEYTHKGKKRANYRFSICSKKQKKKYNRSEKHFTIPVFFSSIQSKNFQEWWAVYSRIKKKAIIRNFTGLMIYI